MNNEKQQQAKNLYFQSDLNKTQIAELLNVSRSSIHYWIKENNWQRLKKSAAMMPSIIAENCYMIMDNFTQSLLSEFRIKRPITHQEADTLHKLTLTIGKLRKRSTINENMEMFAYFMENINKKAPELAEQVQPFVDDYIASQASVYTDALKPEYFNQFGLIPQQEPDYEENKADAQDIWNWNEDKNAPIIDARDLAYMDDPIVTANTAGETPASATTAQQQPGRSFNSQSENQNPVAQEPPYRNIFDGNTWREAMDKYYNGQDTPDTPRSTAA